MCRGQVHVCPICTLPNASNLLTACNGCIPSGIKNKDMQETLRALSKKLILQYASTYDVALYQYRIYNTALQRKLTE